MAKIYVKNTDGTYSPQPSILVSNFDIVQDKGDSLTSAMSQKAVTDELAIKQDKLIAGDGIKIEGSVISNNIDHTIYTTKEEVDNKLTELKQEVIYDISAHNNNAVFESI